MILHDDIHTIIWSFISNTD